MTPITVTILWDDGTMFAVETDEISPADAVEEVWDLLTSTSAIRGAWVGPNGVPQETVRVCRFYERAIRCVMTDDEIDMDIERR
jgi:hypothetical protein